MTYSLVDAALTARKTRTDAQWTRESLRRADKNGDRAVYRQRMLIKMRVDANLLNIRRWYVDENQSTNEIAQRLKTSSNCILRRLRKMDVVVRPPVRYHRKPYCTVCNKPSKGFSELCTLHWRLHAAKRARDWWIKNRKKGASCSL